MPIQYYFSKPYNYRQEYWIGKKTNKAITIYQLQLLAEIAMIVSRVFIFCIIDRVVLLPTLSCCQYLQQILRLVINFTCQILLFLPGKQGVVSIADVLKAIITLGHGQGFMWYILLFIKQGCWSLFLSTGFTPTLLNIILCRASSILQGLCRYIPLYLKKQQHSVGSGC